MIKAWFIPPIVIPLLMGMAVAVLIAVRVLQ